MWSSDNNGSVEHYLEKVRDSVNPSSLLSHCEDLSNVSRHAIEQSWVLQVSLFLMLFVKRSCFEFFWILAFCSNLPAMPDGHSHGFSSENPEREAGQPPLQAWWRMFPRTRESSRLSGLKGQHLILNKCRQWYAQCGGVLPDSGCSLKQIVKCAAEVTEKKCWLSKERRWGWRWKPKSFS